MQQFFRHYLDYIATVHLIDKRQAVDLNVYRLPR